MQCAFSGRDKDLTPSTPQYAKNQPPGTHSLTAWVGDGGYGQLSNAECESTLKQQGTVSPSGEDAPYKDGLQ